MSIFLTLAAFTVVGGVSFVSMLWLAKTAIDKTVTDSEVSVAIGLGIAIGFAAGLKQTHLWM